MNLAYLFSLNYIVFLIKIPVKCMSSSRVLVAIKVKSFCD